MSDELQRVVGDVPFSTNGADLTQQEPSVAHMMLRWVASNENDIPPYWSYSRDAALRRFTHNSGPLKVAVNTFINKLVTIPWQIIAKDRSITRHVETSALIERNLRRNSGSMSTAPLHGFREALKMFLRDYLCLYGRSRVHLGGDRLGQTKTIQEIVEEQDPGPVISIANDGTFVERQIVEWHKTPLGHRRWWWISAENASAHSGKRPGGLWMTEDHPVLTKEKGWALARDVSSGMHIATSDPALSDDQKSVLVGAMLGDSCVSMIRKRAVMRFSHKIDQEEWLDFKLDLFQGFQWTGRKVRPEKKTISVNSRGSLDLTKWRDAWYAKDGTKIMAKDMIEDHFDLRSLAVWYCDDGSIHRPRSRNGNRTRENATIYSNEFTRDECEWMRSILSSLGVNCQVQPHKSREKTYWILKFGADDAETLFAAIGAYIPPSMRYKLPANAPDFNPELWDVNPATTHYDLIRVSEARPLRTNGNGNQVQSTYHIGVEETRNFVAGNLVVHNTTDNGAFMAVMGNGPSDGPVIGAPTGIMHMDSALCIRTKDPEYPVKYLNAGVGGDNKQYKIHYSRVIQMANLPSPEVDLNGVGLCAVSCCVEAAQELWDIWRYNSELFGSHPPRQILYAETGATVKNLKDAKQAWEATMLNEGRSRFGGTMLMAPRISSQQLKLHILSLSSLPQDFNRRDVTTIDKSEIAAGFGLDLRDVSYTLGAPSRTGDAEVQDRKGRGKGIGEFIETFKERFEQVYLNTDVHEITFDYVDDEQDEQQANVRSIRSQARERDLSSGVTTVRVEREEMWSKGEISRQQFEDMELLDGRLPEGLDVMLLFQSDDKDFSGWLDLGVGDPTDISANDPEQMASIIHERYIEVSHRIHEERRVNRRRKALQALAALDKLLAMYQTPQGEVLDEQATLEAIDEGGEQIEGAEEEAEGEEEQEAEEENLNRELGDSKKKQAEIIDPVLLEFEDQFRFFVEQAVGGEIPEEEFRESIADEVALTILLLFLRGSGLSEDELTQVQIQQIAQEIDEALTTLPAFSDDIYQGRYDPENLGIESAMNRIVGWTTVASSAFFLGMMNNPNDPFLLWVIDPMKESCMDCLRLNRQVHRASEWLASGWRPRKWNLECRGIHCGCELLPTTGPARGSF